MLLIALGRVAQFILVFATIKISTTLLPPEEMAKVFMVASLVAFFALVFLNPVGMFMNRRLHAWNAAGKVRHYYNYFWLYLIAICGIAVASLILFIGVGWIDIHTSTNLVLMLVGSSLLFATVNQVVIPALNLLGYRGWFVALTLATAVMSLMTATIFVVELAPKAEFWIFGLLVGQFIFSLIGGKIFFGKVNAPDYSHKPTRHHFDKLIGFAWPISIAVGLGWVQTQSYRFMMESGLGLHALGLFAAGYGISAGVISAFESVFTTYLQPNFYKHISNENLLEQSKAWEEYAGTIFPSLTLVGFVILATAPELTRVILGPEYWSSFQFIGWGVAAELSRVASGAYGMIAHARMKTRLLIAPSLVGATSSIILIWWLMPIFGSNGVGAALMISSVAAFILTYAFTRDELTANLPRRTLITSMLMGVALIILAEVFRWAVGENKNLIVSVATLGTVGVAFLFFQFTLLRPLLRGGMSFK